VILREHLQSLFGECWYATRDAGEYLKGLWATGEREDLDSAFRRIGLRSIVLQVIAEEARNPLEFR